MSSAPLLDRTLLWRAFDLLAGKLARRGVVGELHAIGGETLVLASTSRLATHDVDALFEPHGPVVEAAHEVAKELGLLRSWLNNQASVYVSDRPGERVPVYDHPNLKVTAACPEHLLAMKVRAARATRDGQDLRLLFRELSIRSLDEVVRVLNRFFPGEPLSGRSRQLVTQVLAEMADA